MAATSFSDVGFLQHEKLKLVAFIWILDGDIVSSHVVVL